MAQAKKIPTDNYNVELTLSKEEAEVLLLLTENVGGAPEGPRGHIDSIGRALERIDGLAHPKDTIIHRGPGGANFYIDNTETYEKEKDK